MRSDSVDLLPKLNEQKTYENVTNFFKRDLERIVLMSGSRMTDLASPNLNGAPGSSNFNNVEINLMRKILLSLLMMPCIMGLIPFLKRS